LSSLLALLTCVGLCPDLAHGQGAGWSGQFEKIKTDYYTRQQPKLAIQELEEAIASSGNEYTNSQLTEILKMVKDYFTKTGEKERFGRLVYEMLEPNRLEKIVGYFQGTTLYEPARQAGIAWSAPAEASIAVDTDELDIGESTAFRVSATNQKKKPVSGEALTMKLIPDGLAEILEGKVVARKAGSVTLVASNAEGTALAQREIKIKAGLQVTITPDYKELARGAAEVFTVESNKTFDKFPIKISATPTTLLDAVETPGALDASKKVVRVTAKDVGTGFLVVMDAGGAEMARATLFVPPQPPSKLYPLIGTGVTILAAVWGFQARGSANDKYDEYRACAEVPQADLAACDAAYSDYQDAVDKEKIAWTVTGVAAAGTGYLWYRYLGKKKEYDKKLKDSAAPVSLRVNGDTTFVILSRAF
jgi:hypothetical protein